MTDFPKALAAPAENATLISDQLLREAIAQSQSSPRKRIILPLHKNADAKMHRMLNVIQPGSYIPPHRHIDPPKEESVIVVKGAIYLFLFDNSGDIHQIHFLKAGSPVFGIDCEPEVIHTFIATEKNTVIFETKPGPWQPQGDKDFFPWAPDEESPDAPLYLKMLLEKAKAMSAQN